MSNSSHPQSFDNTNSDELDQKNNNSDRADLNEIKLTVKDDDQQQRLFAPDGALPLHVHQNAAQRRPDISDSLAASQTAINPSNSLIGGVDGHLCNSATADNPSGNNGRSDSNADQQSLPPAYFEVPGIVPFMAASSNQPPPSYEEVINPDVPPPTYSSLFGQVQAARKNAKTLPDLIKKLIIILLGTIGLAILISFTLLIPFTMVIVGGSNLDNCRAEKIPLFLLVGGIMWLAKNLSNFFSQCSSRRTNRSASSSSANRNGSSTNTCSTSTANTCSSGNNGSSSNHPCASRYSSNTCTAESNACQPSTNRSSRCVINLESEQQTTLESQQNKRRDFLINCLITAWFITGCVMVYRVYPPNYTDPTHPNYCNKTVYVYAFWLLTSTFIIFAFFILCICCISLTAIFSSNSEIRI